MKRIVTATFQCGSENLAADFTILQISRAGGLLQKHHASQDHPTGYSNVE
jgi:hypothetical protein